MKIVKAPGRKTFWSQKLLKFSPPPPPNINRLAAKNTPVKIKIEIGLPKSRTKLFFSDGDEATCQISKYLPLSSTSVAVKR
jgi:hypothetical protein